MPKKRNPQGQKKVFVLLIFLAVLFGVVGARFWKYLSIGLQIFTNNKIELKQSQQRVNLLLLGVGGGTHEGPDLTDTIILASIDINTKEAVLISMPRDFWVPELRAKINSAYTTGEEKQKGKGLLLASAVVRRVTGQEIDYALKIDFSGFVKAVDLIGGLDIEVENTFDDYAYPLTGRENDLCGHLEMEIASLSAQIASGSADAEEIFSCRYEHLHFDQGETHMDGITALKYVRSRHAEGQEGSDFARSKRQEKVVAAFKDKIFSLNLLFDPVKALNIIEIIKKSIDTNVKEEEYADFIKLAQNLRGVSIKSVVLDMGDTQTGRPGLLMNPPLMEEYLNQWVLIPANGNGNYKGIQKYVECEINENKCDISSKSLP